MACMQHEGYTRVVVSGSFKIQVYLKLNQGHLFDLRTILLKKGPLEGLGDVGPPQGQTPNRRNLTQNFLAL